LSICLYSIILENNIFISLSHLLSCRALKLLVLQQIHLLVDNFLILQQKFFLQQLQSHLKYGHIVPSHHL